MVLYHTGTFHRVPQGSARRTVVGYLERLRLAEFGFTQSLDTVDADTVEGILTVDGFLAELRDADRRREARKLKG